MTIELKPIDYVDIEILRKWQNENDIQYHMMGFRFRCSKNLLKNMSKS